MRRLPHAEGASNVYGERETAIRALCAANGIEQMDETAIESPAPSSDHATCAWCRRTFVTIVDLIDHIDAGHLPTAACKAEREGRA